MKRFIVLLLTLPMVLSMYGWGAKGHRIVAEVAYQHLTKKAQKQVDNILGKHGMIYWATWPDELKSDTVLYQQSFVWHYQNLPTDLTDSTLIDMLHRHEKANGELFFALDSLTNLLYSDKTNHDALVFVIHLVGDFHCPMHLAKAEDRGGNKVEMKWFGRKTNLHSVWDGSLIDSRGYSYSEYAQYLDDIYYSQIKEITNTSKEVQLCKTYQSMTEIYDYQNRFDGNSYHYVYEYGKRCDRLLYEAGIHLAQLLNSIYK